MSDDTGVVEKVGSEGAAATEVARPATQAVVEDKTLLGGADDAGDDAGADDAATPDWRAKIAKAIGDDPKELRWLNRFTTEENYHKAVSKLRRDFSSGRSLAQSGPPEDATPEEISAYRKATGVPEKADGYGLAFPENMNPTAADIAGLNGWASFAHERHLPPAAAKAGAEYYAQIAAEGRVARAEAAREATINGIAELRSVWKGREFTRNITLANELLVEHAGEEDGPALVGLELANGQKLGDYPAFVRFLAAAKRAYADEEALIGGDGAGGGKSIDDEIAELRTKSVTGKITKKEDERLNQLYEARIAREERQGRARAASAAA